MPTDILRTAFQSFYIVLIHVSGIIRDLPTKLKCFFSLLWMSPYTYLPGYAIYLDMQSLNPINPGGEFWGTPPQKLTPDLLKSETL